ncbi:MAG: S1 RNA-binding domain-containing protein [Clostridia bacterium]|nr:S1 RNA-binding domain-containing protein [Clostridia bacterium]
MSLEIGSIVEGKVSKIMPFGAFVSLPGKKSGLVHISEVARDYVENIADHLKEGDEVKVKVVKIDDDGKISLSIKQALEPKKRTEKKQEERAPKGPIRPADIDWSTPSSADMSFEDKLSRFKQDADEKMQALKRSNDSKRSGGYRRGGGPY